MSEDVCAGKNTVDVRMVFGVLALSERRGQGME
jgi:hypothetical protein